MTRIEVYADWQPGYMGERIPTKRKYFTTLDEATPTIDKWRKTACTIVVSKTEIIETYNWGKKKRAKTPKQNGKESDSP